MKKLDEGDKERIRELHHDGRSERFIAEAIGCSRSAVWAVLQKTKTGVAAVVLALALLVPAASHAALYQYVDVAGTVRVVEASSAEEAALIAPHISASSGVLLYSGTAPVATPTPTSPVTSAEKDALIADLTSKITALLAQIELLEADAKVGDMATTNTPSSKISSKNTTPDEKKDRKEKKEKLKEERGVAMTQATIYSEDDEVFVSLIDYLEGDVVSIVVSDQDGKDVDAKGTESSCEGRIAGEDIKTCKRESTYAFRESDSGESTSLRIKIVVEGEQKQYTIVPGGRGADFRW